VQSVFRIADRMLMLFDAKLVANGTTHEVQASEHPAVRQFLEGRAEGPILAM
jgi:phospholipid/cholesterol/gamma-HCH transport system ATP-binding protein